MELLSLVYEKGCVRWSRKDRGRRTKRFFGMFGDRVVFCCFYLKLQIFKNHWSLNNRSTIGEKAN